jgi:3-oxoacyl-[acyl-carrier protein] reductase
VSGLEGRVALVTGANHGIGAATARLLAGRGAAVLLTYRRIDDADDPGTPDRYREARAEDAAGVVAQIASGGGRALAIEADLADDRAAALLFDEAEREFGPVEILVNNASGWTADTFRGEGADRLGRRTRQLSAESFDAVFAVDARGAALLIAEFARRHVARGASWGRIVGLTSGGPLGFPEEVSYGAAKAAQENLTMSAALELAAHGVTANVVYPPVTDTGWVTDAVRRSVAESSEHVHVARPEEAAEVICWLASDEARLVTANAIRLR